MPAMHLTVRHLGKGMELEATTPQGATIRYDDGEGTFGGSPMQHLLGAVGACALLDVDIILRKKRLEFTDLRVDCVGERPDAPDARPFTEVKLVFRVRGAVPQKAFDDAVRLAVEKYCSIGATLRKGVPVAHEARVDGA